MKQNYFICNTPRLSMAFEQNFTQQGIDIKKFELGETNFSELTKDKCDFILFAEPYDMKDGEYVLHKLWINYLKENNLEHLKVLIAFYGEDDNPNALNLLNLPPNMNDIIQKANTIKEGIGEVKIHRACLQERMELFFSSHSHDSLTDRMVYLLMYLTNVEDIIQGVLPRPYSYVQEKLAYGMIKEFRAFHARWKFYKDYEECPFINEMRRVEINLGYIGKYIEAVELEEPEEIQIELFEKNKCYQRGVEIEESLEKMKTYVFGGKKEAEIEAETFAFG